MQHETETTLFRQAFAALGPIFEKHGLVPAINAGGFASERIEALVSPGGTYAAPYEGHARVTLTPGISARGAFRSRTLSAERQEDLPAFLAQIDRKISDMEAAAARPRPWAGRALGTLAISLFLALSIAGPQNANAQQPKPAASKRKAAAASRAKAVAFSIVLDSTEARKKLDDFLSEHERKIVNLDVFLSEEDVKNSRDGGENRIYINLSYKDKEGFPAGSELTIDLADGENDLVLNQKTGRLQAYLKVLTISGPNQGIMSIYTKPVAIERMR